MRLVKNRIFAAFLFSLALGSQGTLLCRELQPRIAYRIHVDSADLSGFNVEMRISGARDTVRIAMASHPEYDDRYWRYVENLTAESWGAPSKVTVTNEQNGLRRVKIDEIADATAEQKRLGAQWKSGGL